MKRVLVLAPSSYPTYGAEAIVNIKLLKALVDSDKFEIDLVSKRVNWKHYPEEEYDIKFSSVNIIDIDLKVTPTLIWEHIHSFFKFGITFKAVHWAIKALPIVEDLVKRNKYDYVLTKDSPSFVLGEYLKRKYGIKWVATWNDPFPPVKYPFPYGKGGNFNGNIFDRMCVNTMRKADIHIFPSARLRDYMVKYLNIGLETTKVIPHIILKTDVENKIQNDKLRILHSGTLQSPRDPKTFLLALSKFKKNFPLSNIEVSVMGLIEDDAKQLIKELGLSDIVKLIPPVKYSESLKRLSLYHVALIIEADCDEGIFLPTKVTDFMQYKKYIFSISPREGVLNDMYRNKDIHYFADVKDVQSIYDALNEIYNDFISNRFNDVPKSDFPSFTESTIVNEYYNL